MRVDCVAYNASLSRVARVACEVGASFFSVPYFAGCERLRLELTGGCKLEVSGVENIDDFKRLSQIGVGRIVTDKAWEMYTELLKEADDETRALFDQQKTVDNAQTPSENSQPSKAEKVEKVVKENETAPVKADTQTETDKGRLALPTVCPSYPPSSETDYRCQLVGTELKFL